MHSLAAILTHAITISIGSNSFTFGTNVIVYLIVAAIVGLIAETLVGWRLPFGFIGAIIAALIGIWLMTNIIIISGVGDIYIDGVPLIRALIGAIILVAIWHLITYPAYRSRRRYYYRR
ncbi:MAG TPA: hypothetical protein VKR83_01480 [Ktedonobacteraceae bacterium]|nr:hypothetical protein [Ktedonobacteraceae bacterium]